MIHMHTHPQRWVGQLCRQAGECRSLGEGFYSPRLCAQTLYPCKRGKPSRDQKGNEKLNMKHWQVKQFIKTYIFNKAGLTEGIRR